MSAPAAAFGIVMVASHMAGDYLFQSAHMAAHKLTDPVVRMQHVLVYALCFFPAAIIYQNTWWQGALFAFLLVISHYITDSKRWRTSNPWPAMPILQDQSLHAVQIAVLSLLLTWGGS